jgi:hypothetical protein
VSEIVSDQFQSLRRKRRSNEMKMKKGIDCLTAFFAENVEEGLTLLLFIAKFDIVEIRFARIASCDS